MATLNSYSSWRILYAYAPRRFVADSGIGGMGQTRTCRLYQRGTDCLLFPTFGLSGGFALSGYRKLLHRHCRGNGPQPTDSPGVIFLDLFERSVTAFEDPSLVDPCIGDGSCGVDVSVRGKTGTLLAFAFSNTADLPATPPRQAPILPIGSLASNDPCRHQLGGPCRQSGQIVAYDPGPIVVGTWDIAISEVPEPTGMVLIGSALLLLVWQRRSRIL